MTFKITLSSTITAKSKGEAIKEFWEYVDEAETDDLKVEIQDED